MKEFYLYTIKLRLLLIIDIDKAIEKDKTIPDRIGYFDRVYEIIKKYNEQKVEVTDWSQMILFLKIFNNEDFDIRYSQFKIVENKPLQIIPTNKKQIHFV